MRDSAAMVRAVMFSAGIGGNDHSNLHTPKLSDLRQHGVCGAVAIVAAADVPDALFLIERSDMQAMDEPNLREMLSAILGVGVQFITDASSWDAEILSLTDVQSERSEG